MSTNEPWNKGQTKETHPGLARISKHRKKVDNFRKWRKECKNYFKELYRPLPASGDLAELIGVSLGDGNISQFPRTERLIIVSNAKNTGFVNRYSKIVENLFKKPPRVTKIKEKEAIRISFYQKFISKRLGIPLGNRGKSNIKIPGWIWKNNDFLIRYLRGLYEAEGSFCVHKPTSTYKMLFSNRNPSLLENVFRGVEKLGFHPHQSGHQVQLSRKEEVYRFKELIQFRVY